MDWNNNYFMNVRNENVANEFLRVPQWAKAEKLDRVAPHCEIWKRDEVSSLNCRSILDKRIRMEIALGERDAKNLFEKVRVCIAEHLYRLADCISPVSYIS